MLRPFEVVSLLLKVVYDGEQLLIVDLVVPLYVLYLPRCEGNRVLLSFFKLLGKYPYDREVGSVRLYSYCSYRIEMS